MKTYINARFLTQPITGVQRFAIEISRELKKRWGEKITFVSPLNILHSDIAKELEVVAIGNRTGHFWEQIDLPHYLKRQGNPLLINLANTAPLRYKNKVSTIHDVAFNVFPQTYSKVFLLTYRILTPQIVKSSKHIFTVSDFSKNEIAKFYKESIGKTSVIYNATNNNFVKQKGDFLIENENFFLAVSSLNYRKNLISVLKAFNSSELKNKNIKLYIIGDINSNSFKSLEISEHLTNPKIKVLGRVSDEELIKYYSSALAFIYPSLYEGFGIPPLEAQNCGCPIIISDTSCLPEIFKNSALYCDPLDINSIKDCIIRLTEDNHTRDLLIENGYINAQSFSWEKSAHTLYNTIIQFTP